MKLRTLGGLKLEGAVFSQPRPLLLLAYLALEGLQERRHLAELFWPASSQPLGNLRPVLSQIKKISTTLVEGDSARVWTTIDSDARTLLTALEKRDPRSALEVYDGPFLEGVSLGGWGAELEEWVLQTRQFIAGHIQEALLSLAEVEASKGEFQQAGKQAERAYLLAGAGALEPHDLHRVHTLLLAGGNLRSEEVRREALDFDRSLVASQVEARDRLRSLQQEDERPGLSNLPNPRTSFVGRELELSEVTELLCHPHCPLLSLVGAGGVGKTRLALQAAQELLNEGGFSDGVVYVPLETLTDEASIPAVVAGALELTLTDQEDASSVVKRFLEKKRLLLVLDNFEHLLDGASFVRELIDSCPSLKLIATSRERLNLEHEWVFPLEGLTYPHEGATLEQAEAFDAVELFFQRARQAQPTFSLTPEVFPAVSRICQLVGGMPLAIELASSWLRALPVSEIAGELEAGLDMLESSARDVLERHRGVRVVFDHSWSLLSEDKRRALRRLSVFRGGFTRKAAGDVAGSSLPDLAGLVDKSFLRMSPEGRYDRHPLLTQYTVEKLAEVPEERADVEARHGAFYLGLVRELEPDLWTLERKQALRVLQEELANVRAAWDWALENLELDEIEETISAMYSFLESRHLEGFEYFGTTIDFFASIAGHLDENNPDHAGALGTALVHQALPPHGFNPSPDSLRRRSLAERGIELLESLGEPRALAKGLMALGESFKFTGERTHGHQWVRKALEVARKHGSANDIARAVVSLSRMQWGMTDEGTFSLSQQMRFTEEGLEELRALDHQLGVAEFLLEHGLALEIEQRYEKAKERYWEANRLADELGHHLLVVRSFVFLSDMSMDLGEVDQAAAHAEEAYRRAEESGLTVWMYWALGPLGRAVRAQGDLKRARELLLRCMKDMLTQEHWGPLQKVLTYWAELLAAEGNAGDAARLAAYLEGSPVASQVLAELERSMSPEAFAAAVERGRRMTLDEAVDEFLPELSL